MAADDERSGEDPAQDRSAVGDTGDAGDTTSDPDASGAESADSGDKSPETGASSAQPAGATLLPSTAPDLGNYETVDDGDAGWLERNPGWAALIAVLAGIGIGIFIGFLIWESGDDEDEVASEATAEEVATMEETIETLSGENDQLRADNATLEQELTASQAEVEALRDRVDQLVGDITGTIVVLGDFVGGDVDAAVAAAEEQGWLVTVTAAETDQDAAGTVISQAPAPGAPMVAGSALVLTVATEPEPPPEPQPDLEYTSVQVFQGTGDQTTDTVTLPSAAVGAIRVAYQFQADSVFTVEVIDANENVIATIIDVQGDATEVTQGAADVPFAGSVAFRVTTDSTTQWTMDLQALLPQSTTGS